LSSDRQRLVDRRAFPPARRWVTAAMRVGRRMSPIHGLIEVDVTRAVRTLERTDASFTAFVVATVARAAALHPEVHGYRAWLGRIVVHHYVDVSTLIEVDSEGESFPLAYLVRDADVRDVADISREIRDVKRNPLSTSEGRRLARFAPLGGRIPGFAWIVYQVMSRSTRMRAVSGTVAVSSIGMFGRVPGHGIGFPTVLSLSVLVGGRTKRPVVNGEKITVGDVLNLTVPFDHNTVDGAPAARFVADLQRLLTSAEVFD
jgi:pyruvate/2-oxoglutarate dehydrogenase complex dihydrolipoamide acyltransferase (E2) component